MECGGYVYILTNRAHGVLYVGVTANIDERVWQHRNGVGSKFCRKYGLDRLVLVEVSNPEWTDLGSRMV